MEKKDKTEIQKRIDKRVLLSMNACVDIPSKALASGVVDEMIALVKTLVNEDIEIIYGDKVFRATVQSNLLSIFSKLKDWEE